MRGEKNFFLIVDIVFLFNFVVNDVFVVYDRFLEMY